MEHNPRHELVLGPTAAVAAGTPGTWYNKVGGPSGAKYIIERAELMPDAAITAHATNFSIFTLRNVTTSTDLATRSYAATNSVAGTVEALTAAVGKEVTAGDVLSWAKAETASGLACGPRCQLTLRRLT